MEFIFVGSFHSTISGKTPWWQAGKDGFFSGYFAL